MWSRNLTDYAGHQSYLYFFYVHERKSSKGCEREKDRDSKRGSRRRDKASTDEFLHTLYKEIVMRMLMIIVMLMVFSSSALAECTTNARGRTVCSNGEQAGGVNANTGTAWKSEKNQAGVMTTETNRGGEAKTRNGKGVYRSPSGKTCVKTANNHGCN